MDLVEVDNLGVEDFMVDVVHDVVHVKEISGVACNATLDNVDIFHNVLVAHRVQMHAKPIGVRDAQLGISNGTSKVPPWDSHHMISSNPSDRPVLILGKIDGGEESAKFPATA